MKKSRGLFAIRFLALLIAVVVLVGSVPISAVDIPSEDGEDYSAIAESDPAEVLPDEGADDGSGDTAEVPQENGGSADSQSEPAPVSAAPPVVVAGEKPAPVLEIEAQKTLVDGVLYFNHDATSSLAKEGYEDNVGVYKGLNTITLTYTGIEYNNSRVCVADLDATLPENFENPDATFELQTEMVGAESKTDAGTGILVNTFTVAVPNVIAQLNLDQDGSDGFRIWYTTGSKNGDNLIYADLLFFIDDEGPEITVGEMSSDWYLDKASFPLSVEDPSGVGVNNVSADKGSITNDGTSFGLEVTESPSAENPYTVTAYDNLGNESTATITTAVNIDKEAPVLALVSGSDTWGNEQTFTVSVTDGDGNVDLNGFKLDGAAVTATAAGTDTYEVKVTSSGSLVATDLAGRTSNAVVLTMNQDEAAPTVDDIALKFFIRSEGEQQVLDVIEKTFNVHFNTLFSNAENVTMRVLVSRNSGSPITSITAKNGSTALEPVSNEIQTDESGRDYIDFKIDLTDKDSAQKVYDDLRFEVKDSVYAPFATTLNEIKTVHAKEEELPAPISEVVNTKITPEVTLDTDASSDIVTENGNLYAKVDSILKLKVEDKIGRLFRVKVYFDTADKFDAANGFKPSAGAKVITGDINQFTASGYEVDENGIAQYPAEDEANTPKTLRFSYPIAEELTGKYILYIEAQNYSLNIGTLAKEICFDNSKPVISDVQFDKTWTNQPITLTFKAVDEPEGSAVGIDTVTVDDQPATYADGKYSYDMADREHHVIKVIDKLGNSATKTINANQITIDVNAPTVNSVSYNEDLTNTNVVVTVTASDDLSGLKQVFAKNVSDPSDIFSAAAAEGQTEFKLTINTVGQNEYKVYAEDNAGNVTPVDKAKTVVTKIDKSAIAVERVSFDGFVTGTVNGVYSNRNIIMSVKIKQSGLAVLASAKMGDTPVELSEDKLTARFTFSVGTKIDQILENEFTFKNTSGTEATYKLKQFFTSDCEIVVSQEVKGDKELFEIISTNAASMISSITPSFNQMYTTDAGKRITDGANASFQFSITDDITGIDMDKVQLTLSTPDGVRNISVLNNDLNAEGETVQHTTSMDMHGKVTGASFTFTISDRLQTGSYSLKVNETNIAGNKAIERAFNFNVDADAPVISDIQYDTKWTNQSIKLTFKVADKPDTNACGMGSVYVNGTLVEPDNGTYTYNMTSRANHVIQVADAFGNQTSTTISAEEIPSDNTAPVVNEASCSDALTNSDVAVTVKASDNLSGVKKVFAKNTANPEDVFTAEATAADQTEFTLTVSTPGENTYAVFAEDNAGNITPVESAKTITTRIDKSKISIARVSFNTVETGTINGVYSNKEILMSVTIDQPEPKLAVLSSASMGTYPVQLSDDNLTATFTFAAENGGTTFKNLLDQILTLENTAGTKAMLKLTDLLSDSAEIVVDEATQGDQVLFEVIATEASSSISDITPVFRQKKEIGGALYADGVNGSLIFTITDELSGVDMNSVVIMFGEDGGELVNMKDQGMVQSSVKSDKYGKITSAKFTCTLPQSLATGSYIMTVEEKNLAGNSAQKTFSFIVDTTSPAITDVLYDAETWTDDPVTLTFNAVDKPDGSAVGMESVKINGETITGDNGKFTYSMTSRQNYTIEATDFFGNRSTYSIKTENVPFDNKAPQIASAEYNSDESNTPVDVTVTVSDDLSGVKQVYAVNVKNPEDKFTADAETDGQTVFKLKITTEGENTYKVYAVDAAGNVAELKDTITTKIDTSDIRIKKITFDGIVTGQTNGVYSYDDIFMSVYLDDTAGIAVFESATLDGYESKITNKGKVAKFTMPVRGDGTKIENILSRVFTFKNTAGTEVTMTLKELLSESAEIICTTGVSGDTDLIEIIATAASSNISDVTPTFAKDNKEDAEATTYYADGNAGKFEFTISDSLSGVDMNTVKVQFGKTRAFGDTANLTDVTSQVVSATTTDKYNKVTEAKFTYTLPEGRLATGSYTLKIDEKNLAGNDASKTFSFYVDASKPVISNVSYNPEWTNEPITLNFNVTDQPKSDAIGIASVTVNDTALEGDHGVYSYEMTSCQDYLIKATDVFGNEETYEIKAENVPFDDTDPVITLSPYNSKHTNQDVAITVNTSDDLSGIQMVYAENTKDPADRFFGTVVENQKKYVVTISTQGNNTYNIYAVDNAGNISAPRTANPKIDKSDIEIEKVTFKQIENGTGTGVYSNKNILMEVTIAQPVIATLSEAKMTVPAAQEGGEDQVFTGQILKDNLTARFTFPVPADKSGAFRLENLLAYKFYLINSAGTQTTQTLTELLSEGAEVSIGEELKGDKELFNKLFEVVATKASSAISEIVPSFNLSKTRGGVYYTDGIDGKFTFSITDELSGINMNSVEVLFGLTGSLEKIELEPEKTGKDDYGKTVSADYTYTLPENLPVGYYTLTVNETNLSGNKATRSFDFYVDASAPQIDSIYYTVDDKDYTNNVWTNKPITVHFTVTEVPEMNFIGVDKITVIGKTTGNEYTVDRTTEDGLVYHCSFEVKYNEGFTIEAVDQFEHKILTSIDTPLLYDGDKPFITDFVYDDGVNDPTTDITEIDWARTDHGIEVSFDIDDLSANHADNTAQKEDNRATLSDLDTSSVKIYANIPGESEPIEVTPSYNKEGDVYHYTFTASYYATYTVTFVDNAGNDNSATTATIKIDKDDPAFTGVTFERASGANTILNILSFGLYSNDNYKMSVNVKDIAPSSGIGNVQVVVNGKELKHDSTKWEPSEKDPEQAQSDVVGTAVFIIEKTTLSNDKDIEITVTDNAGNSLTKTLYELRHASLTQALMDELKTLITTDEYPEDGYEIVNTDTKPTIISDIDLTGEGVYTDANGRRWFSAKNHPVLKTYFDISEEEAKLAYADITLNGNSVAGDTVSNAVNDEQASLDGNVIHYVKKVVSDSITFEPNLAEYQHMNRTSQSTGSSSVTGGMNKLTIDVEANSGNKNSATEEFYVDDTAPVITNVTFAGNGRADAYADTSGSYAADTVTRAPGADITGLRNYGFYFKDATTISVTATDYRTANNEAINGCDVKEIHVIKMPLGDVSAVSGEATDLVISNVARNSDGSYTATFTIEANYKGKLYFYATDRVDNRSDNYHPDGTIVESLDKHNSTSSATIAVNSTPVAKDNNQHDLFNGSVSLKLTVSDTYSGIHTVSYNITSKWANGADLGSEKITIGQTDTSITGWTIEEKEANSNLITRVSKDITLDGTGIHNLNDIVIHLEATDRAGYEIKPQEDVTLSIDTTAPTIVLTPRDAVHNTYAPENKDYYQDTRVFDITVTERNFNPDDFVSASIITAREGEKPAIIGASNWSTSYDDYTDTSTHTATISFETDGDYTVELNYKDEAGNTAESKKSDDFVIDKINPTISVSFDNNSARNGNYYKDSRVATVTVHEHNFAEGSDYISYSLSAFEGNHTTPRSEPTLATSGWSSNGDEHSTTLNFDQDGLYSFTINYSDKAKRAATEYREAEFIIDFKKTNGKIEFVVGYNNHAFGNQDVMPGVTFTDDNIDQGATSYTLTRVSYDPDNGTSDTKEINDLIPSVTEPDAKTTKIVNYSDFPKEERYDGIYVLKAHLEDKAGNEFDDSITFSVNRFGPTFMSADSNTQRVVKSGYTNDVPNIRVTEINVEEIKTHDVTFTRDTDKKRLEEGTNYKLTKSGSADTWYKYDFDVLKNNFEEEGNYTLTFTANLEYSDDSYNTSITNRTAKTDHGTYPVSFIYDNTAPDVTIEGVSDGSVHSEAEKDIKIICLDSNIDKDSLTITLNDKRLVLNTDYTIDDSLVGELDVDLPITAGMDEKYYDLQVEVKDLANNGGSGEAKNFALSATFFTMFFHNTLAVVLTSVGLAALVGLAIFLIMKKRKKQQG